MMICVEFHGYRMTGICNRVINNEAHFRHSCDRMAALAALLSLLFDLQPMRRQNVDLFSEYCFHLAIN